MFVANVSTQDQDFTYRLPEVPAPRKQMIAAGGQIQVSGDLSREEVEAIVHQHGVYGMAPASEVSQQRKRIYLLYSTDKHVTENQMRQALEKNLALMGDEGVELRKLAALATDNQMAGASDNYRGLEMSIREDRTESPSVNEELTVRPTAPAPAPMFGRSKRRGRG